MIATVARAFFRRGALEAASYRLALVHRLLTLFVSLAAFSFLARFVAINRSPHLVPYGGNYIAFGLIGMVLLNLQNAAVSAYPLTIRAAQLAGTLEAMLATPTPSWMVLICAPLYQFCSSFLGAVAYAVVGGLLFGVRFSSANLLGVCSALPLCLLAFAGIGFLAAALTMITRRRDPVTPTLSALSALFGGVLYPTRVLPPALRPIGALLPLTHALEAMRRALLAGAGPRELWGSLSGLSICCAVVVPLGLLAFSATLRRARVDGSLSHF